MRNWKAPIAIIVAVAAAALLAAFGPSLIPQSLAREWAQGAIARAVNARASVGGVKLKLLPAPGYSIEELGIFSEGPPFQGLSIAHAERVEGSLSILSLVRGRIETDVEASGATFDLRLADGQVNITLPDSPSDILIQKISVKGGGLSVWREGAEALTISEMELSLSDIAGAAKGGIAFEAAGAIEPEAAPSPGAAPPKVGIGAKGRLVMDPARREIAARGIEATLAGMRLTADLSINHGISPPSFDIHIATPDLNPPQILAALFPGKAALARMVEWQGAAAADLTIRGTKDSFEAAFQADATAAGFTLGGIIAKVAGAESKSAISFDVTPAEAAIREGTISLGGQAFGFTGRIARDEQLTARIGLNAQGLTDAFFRRSLPRMSPFDSIEGLEITAEIQGGLASDLPLVAVGDFKAAKVAVAGIEFIEPSGRFERGMAPTEGEAPAVPPQPDGALVRLPILKAALAGGALSGSAWLRAGEGMEVGFDGVIEGTDAGELWPLKGVVAGRGSLVVKAKAQGADAQSLAEGVKLSGSFLMPEGAWSGANPISALFSADTWKYIEEAVGLPLQAAQKERLFQAAAMLKNFNASFEPEGDATSVSASWSHDLYEARVEGKIYSDGSIAGTGEAAVAKAVALSLVPPAAQRRLLDEAGALRLPVAVGGKSPDIVIRLDAERLLGMIEARGQSPARGEVGTPSPAAPHPNMPEDKQKPKGAKKKAGGAPPVLTPSKDEGDILKVIIGR